MNITDTALPEVKLLTPTVHHDARGYFLERFHLGRFQAALGADYTFVQDNHSHSRQGVLRGLHYQRAPQAQGKLVQVLQGEIFDVAVDIRPNSPRFRQWVGVRLNSEQAQQLWVPPGFAHGFLVCSESADVLYKTTTYWHPELEGGIAWDDPSIGVRWPLTRAPQLSDQDATRAQPWTPD